MSQKQYLVQWEIDITASSPEEAAKQALEIQQDKDSEALMFTVRMAYWRRNQCGFIG